MRSNLPIRPASPEKQGVWSLFHTLTADAGSFALSGIASEIYEGNRLIADAGAFTLSGQSSDIHASQILVALSGVFVLTGQPADVGDMGSEPEATIVRMKLKSFTPKIGINSRSPKFSITSRSNGFVLRKIRSPV